MYTKCARNDYEHGNQNQGWVTFEMKIDQDNIINRNYVEYGTGKVIGRDKSFMSTSISKKNKNLGQLDNFSGLTLGLLEECTLLVDRKLCSLLAAMEVLYDKIVDVKGKLVWKTGSLTGIQ